MFSALSYFVPSFGDGNSWQAIVGATRLRFDAQGRVAEHRDYWDAAQELYEKLPLIGSVLRAIRRRSRSGELSGIRFVALQESATLHSTHSPAAQSNKTGKPPNGGRINNQSHHVLRVPNHPTASRSRVQHRESPHPTPEGATPDIMP